ncbi:MAG: cellulase family glycosylhydrolase [Verrucomicrobiales bacterium]
MKTLPLVLLSACAHTSAQPLSLHPDNPHYFLWKGEPAVLITSAEHYGAVLNLDFDYSKYLATLAKDGLNLTRAFSGVYYENPGAFNIERNTLAPPPNRYIGPWRRSLGGKFDLTQWDDRYFHRLKSFVREAGERGVIVEMTLFCPFYKDEQWALSPMNPSNNLQQAGPNNREHVYTLDKHAGLLPFHDAVTQEIVSELKEADNVYYEICNEPYFGGVTLEWQRHIADIISAAEKDMPARHLISQNIANGKAKIENPHQAVSIFNFHYASPPDTVPLNYGLNKAIGDNETGFKGTPDRHYRMEAWEFLLAGGALYNNLDYSFTVGHEDGSFTVRHPMPGGGGAELRRQMRTLRDFMYDFNFIKMRPAKEMVQSGVPEGARVQLLAESGQQYALYLNTGGSAELALDTPPGNYDAEWLNPVTGKMEKRESRQHTSGHLMLKSPPFAEDIALRLKRK